MNRAKNILALIMVLVVSVTLGGCGTNASKLPLQSPLTKQEVIDYYANSMSYDTIASRNIAARPVLEFRDVTDVEKKNMGNIYSRLLNQFKADNYVSGSLMSKEQHQHFKGVIDDLKLNSGEITGMKYASGCYFIEVKYGISPKTTGTFTGLSNYLGIHGALADDGYGGGIIDETYMYQATSEVNKYLAAQASKPHVIVDESIEKEPVQVEDNEEQIENNEEQVENNAVSRSKSRMSSILPKNMPKVEKKEENKEEQEVKNEEQVENNEEQVENNEEQEVNNEEQVVNNVETVLNKMAQRKTSYNATLYNKAAGSSQVNTAFIPKNINSIYNTVGEESQLNGYGIFPQGAFGLVEFGYDRSKMDGEIEVTYIISQDTLDNTKYTFWGLYIDSFNNDYAKEKFDKASATVSDFVVGEIGKILDRVDRVVSNKDAAGLMSKELFNDMGMGISQGLYRNNSNVDRFMSKIVGVKQTKNNYYLVEIERTIEDSSGSMTDTAVYRDTYYQVYKQEGYSFKLDDYIWVARECIREPQPDNQSEMLKMLASLNLKGEIGQDTKTEIGQLFQKYYKAGNDKNLPEFNSCYSSDTDILSSTQKDYLSNKARNLLKKYGNDVKSQYSGKVKEWMGGSENQAELILTETIDYGEEYSPLVMEVYYLMYKGDSGWVIAEYKILESNE